MTLCMMTCLNHLYASVITYQKRLRFYYFQPINIIDKKGEVLGTSSCKIRTERLDNDSFVRFRKLVEGKTTCRQAMTIKLICNPFK